MRMELEARLAGEQLLRPTSGSHGGSTPRGARTAGGTNGDSGRERLKQIEMDEVQAAFYRLQFRLAFHEKKGVEFQDWFVKLAARAFGSDLEAVRPYGNRGDLKCDGRRVSTGAIFQCFMPADDPSSVHFARGRPLSSIPTGLFRTAAAAATA